jgi:hypothetical protein
VLLIPTLFSNNTNVCDIPVVVILSGIETNDNDSPNTPIPHLEVPIPSSLKNVINSSNPNPNESFQLAPKLYNVLPLIKLKNDVFLLDWLIFICSKNVFR